jgi:transposase InsO family protein
MPAPGRCGATSTLNATRDRPLDDYRSFNALAETVNGLYKAELIDRRGPWRTVEQVELETATWVHWWNSGRFHTACGHMPPAEYEAAYWADQQVATVAV